MDPIEKSYFCNVLRDDRESLKWLWLLVMAFAMESAAETAYKYLIVALPEHKLAVVTDPALPEYDEAIKGLLIFVLVFSCTFMRFVYGGSRYFDLKYIEVAHIARYQSDTALERELIQFKKVNSLADVAFLLVHGILFVVLGKTMANMQIFSVVYGALLVTNVIFLLFVIWNASTATEINELRHAVGFPKREETPRTWAIINASTIGALFVLMVLRSSSLMGDEGYFWACMSLFILNSILDLWFTWDFYFPSWRKLAAPAEASAT